MNDIDKLLNEVCDQINNEECVKEYFRLQKLISEDKQLKELEQNVCYHQKEMCKHENNDEIYFKEKELYEKYLKELESNPIYLNFIEVKKEVSALLMDMRDFLM